MGTPRRRSPPAQLPPAREVLAVCAHPDDETFGLGGILAAFAERGAAVRVLCFTHGEASTLGAIDRPLGAVRAEELRAAAAALGIGSVDLHAFPDGHLSEIDLATLVAVVEGAMGAADLAVVFDRGGITGHADHHRATEATLVAAERHGLRVLAWALPRAVARRLNTEFGTAFVGRDDHELDLAVEVDRARQRAAIACHATQSTENPVLLRRLELLGDHEHLRWLLAPGAPGGA